MKLEIKWNLHLVMIFGLIAGFVKSLPVDMESIKDGIQMGMLNGAGMAMDLAEKANFKGKTDQEISLGELKMRRKFDVSGGLMGNNDDSSSEEDRKKRRRRRSAEMHEENPTDQIRSKRSPCLGRRQQATAAPATGGGGTAAGTAAGAGAANGAAAGGAGTPGANPDDLRRRRKRSPDEIDSNENIIPYQRNFGDRTQEIGEKIRQMMKNMLDALAGAFENLKRNFENGMSDSPDMQ